MKTTINQPKIIGFFGVRTEDEAIDLREAFARISPSDHDSRLVIGVDVCGKAEETTTGEITLNNSQVFRTGAQVINCTRYTGGTDFHEVMVETLRYHSSLLEMVYIDAKWPEPGEVASVALIPQRHVDIILHAGFQLLKSLRFSPNKLVAQLVPYSHCANGVVLDFWTTGDQTAYTKALTEFVDAINRHVTDFKVGILVCDRMAEVIFLTDLLVLFPDISFYYELPRINGGDRHGQVNWNLANRFIAKCFQ